MVFITLLLRRNFGRLEKPSKPYHCWVMQLLTVAAKPMRAALSCQARASEMLLARIGPAAGSIFFSKRQAAPALWRLCTAHRRPACASAIAAVAAASVVPGDPRLWQYFAELTQIPRPSKHEARVLDWLKAFAKARNLGYKQDAVGNLVIHRPGSGGGELAPTVVIQGHIDMVCEKNKDTVHDFMNDPLTLRRDGDWLLATGTTLGADNGIGVATALALLDSPPTAKLPPLECLFTVDEETGLTGAYGIASDLVKGRTMLNLDTEDWGEIFIGCAGGGDSKIYLDVPLQPAPVGCVSMQLDVGGLLGGHSGLNIHEGRGNAVKLLARAVRAVLAAAPGAHVVSLQGGDKRNAIAREAQALLLVPTTAEQAATQAVQQLQGQLIEEYGKLEKELFVRTTATADVPEQVLQPAAVSRLLGLISVLPHGPLKMSHEVAGLVETSNNVASVQLQPVQGGQKLEALIVTSTRSSMGHALEGVRSSIEDAAVLAGACMLRGPAYPGWQPRLDSAVLQVVRDTYRDMTGQDAKVGAIHAGLECGILGEKFPGMDMVSFGPTIKGAHSPDERVQISTVESFWELTVRVLERLAECRSTAL